jgi:diguanylate cyclase (GGDEF)-like protein/PAS domain S-box-containing protein
VPQPEDRPRTPGGLLFAGVLRRIAVRRPVAIVSTAILGMALVAGAIAVVQFGDQSTREADVRLNRHAESVANSLSELFASASRDLRLARLNSTYDLALGTGTGQLSDRDRALIEGSITYVGDRYHVDEICLIRSNGAETARWNGGQVASVASLSSDESANPFFKPALGISADSVFVTQPYVSPDSHRWVFGFATPIILNSGQRAGVLHFEIPIQRLVDLVVGQPFGTSGYTVVIDQSGRVLAHPDLDRLRAESGGPTDPATAPFPAATEIGSASWRSVVQTALADPTAAGQASIDDGGAEARVDYQTVSGTSLIVLTVSPTSELYADVGRARLNLIVTVGPLILLMVAVSAWFATRLAGSNRRLAAASRASSQLASIVETADDAILSVEPDGRIATLNAGARSMYGLNADELVGRRLDVLFAETHGDELPRLLETVMAGEPVERHETVHRAADGSMFNVWLTFSPIRDSSSDVIGVSVIARDISDRKRLEDELAHQALHDSLTGLPNRVLFHDRLRQSLHRARRMDRAGAATGRHAVLFVDLDDFKLINDTLGHRIGDELLVAVAGRLRDAVRAVDTAARLGGDEFTILLEDVSSEADAEHAADRVLDELRRPFDLEGHQVVVSASIGIAFGDAGADDPDDLLRYADTALYEAKGQGKGRHETYQQTMNVRAWRRLELESELRLAITRSELRVEYQPIVELATRRVVGAEALVRWQHPVRGIIAPNDFIPLAEQTGLIAAIGEFVRETACACLADWQRRLPEAADLVMSVNVSPRELADPGFAEAVAATIARHGLVGGQLALEITERTTLEAESAIETLRQLQVLGIRVSIDDFGTGYSSLGSFRDLPIVGLKIDRAFINGLGLEREDTAIATAAIAFGHALDVEIVGEGIETELQMDRLIQLGCRFGQGFLFSRPVAATEFLTFIRRNGITSAA